MKHFIYLLLCVCVGTSGAWGSEKGEGPFDEGGETDSLTAKSTLFDADIPAEMLGFTPTPSLGLKLPPTNMFTGDSEFKNFGITSQGLGTIKPSDSNLDFALAGDGYLRVINTSYGKSIRSKFGHLIELRIPSKIILNHPENLKPMPTEQLIEYASEFLFMSSSYLGKFLYNFNSDEEKEEIVSTAIERSLESGLPLPNYILESLRVGYLAELELYDTSDPYASFSDEN